MPTLGETLQAKLTAAKAEVASLEAEIADAEPGWLSADLEHIKAFFAAIGKHIGL